MSLYAALVAAAAVATGLAGGVLYAFSAFVMAGLRRLPPDDGAAAMRAINRDAVRPPLMVLLLATVGFPVAGAVVGLAESAPGAGWAVGGAVVAVVGVLGVTGLGNVPLNDRLEAAQDTGAEWQRFVPPWLRWNHVRTVAGAVACAMFVVAA
ncbi:anthrone oxygenase family protein [Isoptericola croceus]|uniref:anthrone oxygenase family protein n=1 Tax=Isoptericola croceus TaxID=3031406 RepID=UPI0023F853E7|nr:anthrone oxygenase family protein [Isoptericola croceus]